MLALGVKAGPKVGEVIKAFEAWWLEEGFPADKKEIAQKLHELAAQ